MSFFIKKKKRHTGVLNSLWNKWQLWNQFCSFTLKTVVFVWVSLSTIYKCKFVILWWLCVSRNKKTNLGQKRERIKKKPFGIKQLYVGYSGRWKLEWDMLFHSSTNQTDGNRGSQREVWVTEGAKDVKGTGYKLIESEERLLSPLR